MHRFATVCLLAFLPLMLPAEAVPAGQRQVLFREEFATLDNWRPFTFPKIKSHSTYTIERDGDARFRRLVG